MADGSGEELEEQCQGTHSEKPRADTTDRSIEVFNSLQPILLANNKQG